MKRVLVLLAVVIAVLATSVPAFAGSPQRDGAPPIAGPIYVTGQGLYYDVILGPDLPMNGRFQKLENGQTEFGPGDPGYLGGRWWIDNNNNDLMDSEDTFFLCPLLGPGRDTP